MKLAAAVAVLIAGVLASGASAGKVPGTKAYKVCAAAGPYWPTMTLALDGRFAWIACKEQSRVVRLDTAKGKLDRSIRLDGPTIAVAAGAGAVWALDSGGTLYRLDRTTGKVRKRIRLGAAAPYNVWVGAGSVWVADDQGAAMIRVSPAGRVVARIPVGDGPADIAFGATAAWVIDHRDRKLMAIDLRTNRAHLLATVPGDAPERLVLAGGSLWLTGRGTDVVQVDPGSGMVGRTIDVGASGIDIAAADGSLWVPSRSDAVDPTGLPTMDAMRRISLATGRVATVATAVGRVDVHGLAARGGTVWFADNTAGFVYRLGS